MKWLIVLLCFLFLFGMNYNYPTPSAYPSQPEWFPAHSYRYPSIYIGPARTGLVGEGKFYPNRYVISNEWFTGYLKYSHRAYSDVRTVYASHYAVDGY